MEPQLFAGEPANLRGWRTVSESREISPGWLFANHRNMPQFAKAGREHRTVPTMRFIARKGLTLYVQPGKVSLAVD